MRSTSRFFSMSMNKGCAERERSVRNSSALEIDTDFDRTGRRPSTSGMQLSDVVRSGTLRRDRLNVRSLKVTDAVLRSSRAEPKETDLESGEM